MIKTDLSMKDVWKEDKAVIELLESIPGQLSTLFSTEDLTITVGMVNVQEALDLPTPSYLPTLELTFELDFITAKRKQSITEKVTIFFSKLPQNVRNKFAFDLHFVPKVKSAQNNQSSELDG